MGRIFDKFFNQIYINEGHVELNFVYPLLKKFLGYKSYNIFPKKRFRARNGFELKEVYVNREEKIPLDKFSGEPDFIVVNDVNYKKFFYKNQSDKALFLVEAKGPDIDLDKFINQKNAYCSISNTNLIVMTNGTKFYIYDFNELLIKCENIEELEQKFPLIEILLHKENQFKSLKNKIARLYDEEKQFPDINRDFIDFHFYIKENLSQENKIIVLKEQIQKKIDFNIFKFKNIENRTLDLQEVMNLFQYSLILKPPDKDDSLRKKEKIKNFFIFRGESGVGKTQFVFYLKSYFFDSLIMNKGVFIPIYLKLKVWRENNDILNIIENSLVSTKLKIDNIKKYLVKGSFILFLDAYDDIPINDKEAFLKDLISFRDTYPMNKIIITTKTEITISDLNDDKSFVILVIPPDLKELEQYVQYNLKYNLNLFFDNIKRNNLTELVKRPIFLNYLIVYINRLGEFPSSKFEILEKLVNNYFNEHIKDKHIIKLGDFNISKNILTKLAFTMLFNLKKESLNKKEYWTILKEITADMRNNFDIEETISDNIINNFFLNYNFLINENNTFSFYHPILLEYFSAYEFADKINLRNLLIPHSELFTYTYYKNSLIISYPLIENDEYKQELKQTNIFLYIESVLEKPELGSSEIDYIKDILLKKITSQYNFIQQITMKLIEKLSNHLNNPEEIFINILLTSKEINLVRWAILEIGKCKNDVAKSFLLKQFEELNELSINNDLVRGYYILALSNFSDQEIQDKIIDDLEIKWRGDDYLNTIGTALFNLTKRNELSKRSFDRIMNIYENPKESDSNYKRLDYIDIIRKDALERVLIQYNDSSLIPRLISILKKEDYSLPYSSTETILSELISEADLPFIFGQILDDNISIEFKNKLGMILYYSKLKLDFMNLFEILRYIQSKGLTLEKIDLKDIFKDYEGYKEAHPEFLYHELFNYIIEIFQKEHRILNNNIPKLVKFLECYLNFPSPLIQDAAIKYIGKFDPQNLLIDLKYFYSHSFLSYLEFLLIIDKKKSFRMIEGFTDKFLGESDEFYSHDLFMLILELLLNSNEIEYAEQLNNRFLETEVDYLSLNPIAFRIIPKFTRKYGIELLNHLKEKFLILNDVGLSKLRQIINFMPPIDDERYINFCLDIAKLFPKKKEHAIFQIFRKLESLITPKHEDILIEFINKKINDGYNVNNLLSILTFIGTEKSIKFLAPFLNSSDINLKQSAFHCIKWIKEAQNINWYNGEELVK